MVIKLWEGLKEREVVCGLSYVSLCYIITTPETNYISGSQFPLSLCPSPYLSLSSLFHSHTFLCLPVTAFFFTILFSFFIKIALLSAVPMPYTFPAGLLFFSVSLKRSIIQWYWMVLKYNNRFPADGQGQNLQIRLSVPEGNLFGCIYCMCVCTHVSRWQLGAAKVCRCWL